MKRTTARGGSGRAQRRQRPSVPSGRNEGPDDFTSRVKSLGDLMDGRDPMKPRRCTARSKQSGIRCKRVPIPGGTVCTMHGGAAPQVRKSARERIAALVHPALDTLQRALNDTDVNAAVRAARDLLDRAGYAARQGVDLSFTTDPFAAVDRAVREANGG